MNKTSGFGKIIAAFGVVFALYNILVFTLAGFEDHYSSFWIAYAGMDIALLLVSACIWLLRDNSFIARDWLLGYPIYKHCIFYVIFQVIFSILFMALDQLEPAWQIPFVIQIIALAVFLVLVLACFTAKSKIEQVEANVKTTARAMRMFNLDVASVAALAQDANVKKALMQLAEEVRYSDPVSSDDLADIEARLTNKVSEIGACLNCGDNAGALECTKQAMLLLSERNRMCKAFK